MKKLTGGIMWDKMGRDERMEMLKATGSFPGNIGKSWAELSDGAKTRLLSGEAPKAEVKTKPDTTKAETKPGKKPAKKDEEPDFELDPEVVKAARARVHAERDGLLYGHWPETAKNYPGLYFIAVPNTDWIVGGEVIIFDLKSEKEVMAYVEAILKKGKK